jgi:hypothetical protein
MDIRGSLETSFLSRRTCQLPGPLSHQFASFRVPFMSNYTIDNLMNHHHQQQQQSPPNPQNRSSVFFPHHYQPSPYATDQLVDSGKG